MSYHNMHIYAAIAGGRIPSEFQKWLLVPSLRCTPLCPIQGNYYVDVISLLIYINFKEQTVMLALRIAASRMGISRIKWLFRLWQPWTLEMMEQGPRVWSQKPSGCPSPLVPARPQFWTTHVLFTPHSWLLVVPPATGPEGTLAPEGTLWEGALTLTLIG